MVAIDYNFADLFEVDGYFAVYNRLNLPQPPFGMLGTAHQLSGCEKFNHGKPFVKPVGDAYV